MLHLTTPQEAAKWLKQRVTGALHVDNRMVDKGDGFIAWPGAANDGRKFVLPALAGGATACLVERSGSDAYGFNDDRVASYSGLKQSTGLISATYYGWPSREVSVVAVTGTNGKTSTTWWLAQALNAISRNQWPACGLIGTFGSGIPDFSTGATQENDPLTSGITSTGLTTPDPVGIQQSLRHFVDSGVKYCAIEASSIGIREQRLEGTQIHTAIFTNLTLDHLDYHGTLDAYWLAKRELFNWPGLEAAVVNIDDQYGAELARDLSKLSSELDVWTFSCKGAARLVAENVCAAGRGISLEIVEKDERYALALPFVGDYNAANVLAVIGALRSLGVSLKNSIIACRRLKSVPGRMECQGAVGEPLVVVDYAHTPDALEKTLAALRPYAQASNGRLICIFGCGGDRDKGKRPIMGAIAAMLADTTVLTNDNPRSETPSDIIRHIAAGIPKGCAFRIESDREQAIQQSIFAAEAGDVVLVAGKGHESFQEISGIRYPFSDKLCVKASLVRRRSKRTVSRIAS